MAAANPIRLFNSFLILTLVFLGAVGIHGPVFSFNDLIDTKASPGGRAMSLGGGSVNSTVAQDFSTIYWNPAGLAAINGREFYTSFQYKILNAYQQVGGYSTAPEETFFKLDGVGYVHPIPTSQGALVFAGGLIREHELSEISEIFYPYTNGDLDSTHEWTNGHVNSLGAAMAISLSEKLNVGVRVAYLFGEGIKERDQFYLSENVDYFQIWKDNYNGFKINGGLRYQIIPEITVSVTLVPFNRVRATQIVDSALIIHGDLPEFVRQGWDQMVIRLPLEAGAGLAYRRGSFMVAGNIEYHDWENYELESETDPKKRDQYQLESTWEFGMATEVLVPKEAWGFPRVRAGYSFDPSPVKGYQVTLDRQFVSGGIGLLVDKVLSVDLGVRYGITRQNFSDELNTLLEKRTTKQAILSFGYRF